VTGESGPPLAQAPPPRAEERQAPSFARLGRWDWIAFVAALALMFTMSIDWYTTKAGEEFRRIEQNSSSNEQIQPTTNERAAEAAEKQEKNAWQADAFVDRLILIALLATFAAATLGAFLRAAARRVEPDPIAVASLTGTAAAALIAYRMIQEPGLDAGSVLKVGAPLSLLAVGIVAFAARQSVLEQRRSAED
jgi:hypothetical protein